MSHPLSLTEVLAEVPDPRKRRGQRHPLSAILNLTVVAILAGMKSLEAIAQFGRDHGPPLAHALGFHRKTPCKATFSNLFRVLDVEAFEAALLRWLESRGATAGDVLTLDGKTLRGTREGEIPGIHLLSAYAPEAAAVVAQLQVDSKTNEHKAALELLGVLPVQGKVITGDAMFCQRDVCQEIVQGEGDYLFFVKDNQPNLRREIALAFASDEGFSPLGTTAAASHTRVGPDGWQRAWPDRDAHAHKHDESE